MAKIGINLSTGSLQQDEVIVGIDLGTTNSLVAVMHSDSKKPFVVKDIDGSSLLPSVIHINPGGTYLVGNEAKKFLVSDPANTIFSVKRLIGKSAAEIDRSIQSFGYGFQEDGNGTVKIKIGERFLTAVELSSMILQVLKARVEHILKTPVNKAVITVPAFFNEVQRQATREAGILAGLDVLRILNEPTAASLAYGIGLQGEEHKTIAVYDFGGGTFDISILRITEGIFEVLATNGDTQLGGDDFDAAIVDYWLSDIAFAENKTGYNVQLQQELRVKAEEAKKQLSIADVFHSEINGIKLSLSRQLFQNLIAPFVNKTIQSCSNALSDAKLQKADIDEVVMVGGTTRVPFVQEQVSQFFGKKLHTELNPDEVVALGAAVQADVLAGNNKDILLLDITPLSLGIETMGGLMDVLIPRNSKIPTRAARQYTTQKDGQSGLTISVYQGERDLVQHNRKLASFVLSGIPAMPAGLPKVDISFLINSDGILLVTAKEMRSGVEQHVQVRPQNGLTDADVENMLMDSIDHAQEDISTRALVEARTEAETAISNTTSFLSKHKSNLSDQEISRTNEAVGKLKQAMATASKDDIRHSIDELDQVSRPYAERVMDQAIQESLRGKNIQSNF